MNKPYIGVTDFTSRSQVEIMKAAINPTANRRLHVGAMISYKTLLGIPTSTGWENIWLNERGLHELFADDKEVFNVLHYADYDHLPGTGGHRAPTTVEHLLQAINRAGPYVHGLQLDMVWPEPRMLAEFKYARPGVQLIQQVSSRAMQECSNWLDVLEDYTGIVDYVLLDTGMGRGVSFDPGRMLYTVRDILHMFPDSQIAIAGGLGPTTYTNLRPLIMHFPRLSCDAQGQLRPSGKATDPLDFERVEQYIKGICSLCVDPYY